jgi:hypothetical protein
MNYIKLKMWVAARSYGPNIIYSQSFHNMNLSVSILYSKQMKKNKIWFPFQLSEQEKWNFISPSTFTEPITFDRVRVKYERVLGFLISHNEVSIDAWFMQQNVPLILLDGFEASYITSAYILVTFVFQFQRVSESWIGSLTTLFNHYSSHLIVLLTFN